MYKYKIVYKTVKFVKISTVPYNMRLFKIFNVCNFLKMHLPKSGNLLELYCDIYKLHCIDFSERKFGIHSKIILQCVYQFLTKKPRCSVYFVLVHTKESVRFLKYEQIKLCKNVHNLLLLR